MPSVHDVVQQTLQLHALNQAGCGKIFREKVSGAYRDRPELNRMLEQLRDGDVVTVWKLDQLARSTRNLLEIVEAIRQARARLNRSPSRGLPGPALAAKVTLKELALA